jgi:alanine racemase
MFLSRFFRKHYQTLNTIEISRGALLGNYKYLSGISDHMMVAPVLKSNAYGHGLVTVAKILDSAGAPFFCVDSLYEAYELMKNRIRTPVLIMGYIHPDNLKVKKLPFSYAVYDRQMVAAISKYQLYSKIHIFVDTGMHREGVAIRDLPDFLDYCLSFKNIEIEGLMSHFGASEEFDNSFTQKQIVNFGKAREMFWKAGIKPKWIHISNSSGILNLDRYKNKIGNLSRCGIALYGVDPDGKDFQIQPVLDLKSVICQVKILRKGEGVGYNFTYVAKKDMVVGVLPLGYYDGVDRRLSNKGFVKIGDVFCPIIGRVSMNLTSVDLSQVRDPFVGQAVSVYSSNPADKNSVPRAASLADAIAYDLLVHLAESTRRVVV